MKYYTFTYNTRLGKISAVKVHIEAQNKEEAIKKCDALVIRLSSNTKDAIAYTNPKEEE